MEEEDIAFVPDPTFLGSLAGLLTYSSTSPAENVETVQPHSIDSSEATEPRPPGEADEDVDHGTDLDLLQRPPSVIFDQESSAADLDIPEQLAVETLARAAASALSYSSSSSSDSVVCFSPDRNAFKPRPAGEDDRRSSREPRRLSTSSSVDIIDVPPPPTLGRNSSEREASSPESVTLADPFNTDIRHASEPRPPGEEVISERPLRKRLANSSSFESPTTPLAVQAPPPPVLRSLEHDDSDMETSSSDSSSVVSVAADPFDTGVNDATEPRPPGEDEGPSSSRRRRRSSRASSSGRPPPALEATQDWEQKTNEFLSRIGSVVAPPSRISAESPRGWRSETTSRADFSSYGHNDRYGSRSRSRSPPRSSSHSLFRGHGRRDEPRVRDRVEEEHRQLTTDRPRRDDSSLFRRRERRVLDDVGSGIDLVPTGATTGKVFEYSHGSTAAGSMAASATVAAVSAAAVDSASLPEDALPPGNYLLACWDGVTLGSAADGVLLQLGAFLPHGAEFLRCLRPREFTDDAMRGLSDTFVNIGAGWYQRTSRQIMPAVDPVAALGEFLLFLENGCRSSSSAAPAHDGVVLLTHLQETIPFLLKTVHECGLLERFAHVVKGMGDMCSYLAKCHMKRFTDGGGGVSDTTDLSLPNVYSVVFAVKFHKNRCCDEKARAAFELLQTLLRARPDYANFFCQFVTPLKSRAFQSMISQVCHLTQGGRGFQRDNRALQNFNLNNQEPSSTTTSSRTKDLPNQERGRYPREGEEETTYFSRRRSDATSEPPSRPSLLSNNVNPTSSDWQLQQAQMMAYPPPPSGSLPQQTSRAVVAPPASNLIQVQDRKNSKEVTSKLNSLRGIAAYFEKRLAIDALTGEPRSKDNLKAMTEALADVLVDCGLDHGILKRLYEEDLELHDNRQRLRAHLRSVLAQSLSHRGPAGVDLGVLVSMIVDYCSTTMAESHTAKRVRPALVLPSTSDPDLCPLCREEHSLQDCGKFLQSTTAEYRRRLLEKFRKCLVCFKDAHGEDCTAARCKDCNGRHHRLVSCEATCRQCRKTDHVRGECPRLLDFHVLLRAYFIRASGGCQLCLGSQHDRPSECRGAPCPKCKGAHHAALHIDTCAWCFEPGHLLEKCRLFRMLSGDTLLEKIADDGRCPCCLEFAHDDVDECEGKRCSDCGRPHHEKLNCKSARRWRCVGCGEAHPLAVCPHFLKLAPTERLKRAEELSLCGVCLGPKHDARRGRCAGSVCWKCLGAHHTLLHQGVASTTLCPVCSVYGHRLANCEQFLSHSSKVRRRFVCGLKRCVVCCLNQHQDVLDCGKLLCKPCSRCNIPHHPTLDCRRQRRDKPGSVPSKAEASNVSQSGRAVLERQLSKDDHARSLESSAGAEGPCPPVDRGLGSQGFSLGLSDTARVSTVSNLAAHGSRELPVVPRARTVSHAYVEAAKATLDEAVEKEFGGASSPEFRNRLFSLVSLKVFVTKRLSEPQHSSSFESRSVSVVADHVQRLVALLGFNMFRLRQLFEQSEAMLTQSVVATLRPRPELVPPGLAAEDVAQHVTAFFLSQPGRP